MTKAKAEKKIEIDFTDDEEMEEVYLCQYYLILNYHFIFNNYLFIRK
jgi:hypothetical protein